MYYLYGSKPGVEKKLVATFDSQPQLLSYVNWAIVSHRGGRQTFEKGSSLASYHGYSHSEQPLTDDDPQRVDHNPSPSML